MDIKMIVCDLDATLLNSEKEVSQRNLEVLEKCRARGIKIGIATARSECSAKRITDIVRPDVLITSGGAVARCDGQVVYSALLDAETTNGIVKRLLAESGVGVVTVRADEGYLISQEVITDDPAWRDYYESSTHIDFTQKTFEPAQKIVPQITADLAKAIAADFPNAALTIYTGYEWAQFSCKNATKWRAVAAVAEHLGISTDQVAAFGDDHNDTQMLANCGFGVAMDNAIPEIKAVAKYFTATNDEDGVAVWLAENVL